MSRKLTINQTYYVNGLDVECQLDPNGSPARLTLWVQAGPNALGFHRLEAVKCKVHGFERFVLEKGKHPNAQDIQSWLRQVGNTVCNGTY